MAITSMRWALNSPAPIPADAIVKAMAGELAHWRQVLDIRLLKNKVAQHEALAAGRTPEPEQDSPTEMTDTHRAAMAHMEAAIGGASAVAAAMDQVSAKPGAARYNVTVAGHVGMEGSEGVEQRMQIYVDEATEPRNGWV